MQNQKPIKTGEALASYRELVIKVALPLNVQETLYRGSSELEASFVLGANKLLEGYIVEWAAKNAPVVAALAEDPESDGEESAEAFPNTPIKK